LQNIALNYHNIGDTKMVSNYLYDMRTWSCLKNKSVYNPS
jgi:hypothetical protein